MPVAIRESVVLSGCNCSSMPWCKTWTWSHQMHSSSSNDIRCKVFKSRRRSPMSWSLRAEIQVSAMYASFTTRVHLSSRPHAAGSAGHLLRRNVAACELLARRHHCASGSSLLAEPAAPSLGNSVAATNYCQCYSPTWPMPPDVHVPRHST